MIDSVSQRVLSVGIVGILLTFARRWHNKDDSSAGMGVAGWTIFIIMFVVD